MDNGPTKNTPGLAEGLDRLNQQQREAVEHIDGPLLVVAGPGTGKTQLLSLRAANILAKRDVQPKNILCLTYSNAGAEAMRKRLVELIGRDAYGIEVATFHSFAESVRSRWPGYFDRRASDTLASDLVEREIVNRLLNALTPSSALFANPKDGVNAFLGDMLSFIGNFKKSGLTTDEYREILRYNLDFFACAYQDEGLMSVVNANIPRGTAQKEEHCEQFEQNIVRVCDSFAHTHDGCPVDSLGVYVPYDRWLKQLVQSSELIDDDMKTSGLADLSRRVFEGSKSQGLTFRDEKVCIRALEACDIYDGYVSELAARGLYDYDDMILDAIAAIESSPSLQGELRSLYEFIQVDEFQDTNGAQMRILELLVGDEAAPNIMAVCDDDQAIMRFQGASIECIRQFQEKWHPKNVVLKTNYRSTPAVVELGKAVAAQVQSRLAQSVADKDVEAFRDQVGDPDFREYVHVSEDAERYALARSIREALDAGFVDACDDPDEAIAVISNKNAKLKALIPYLNEFDIPFSYKETSDVFQMESMQTLLAALRYVAYSAQGRTDEANAQLPLIVAGVEFDTRPGECTRLAKVARRDFHRDWDAALASEAKGELGRYMGTLRKLADGASGLPVRELVIEAARPLEGHYIGDASGSQWGSAEFNAGVRALLACVEDILAGNIVPQRALRITDVVDCLDALGRFGITINASIALGKKGAVRLVTAHGSKGLEFDRVYLLDADDRTWHKGSASSSFFPENMLVGDKKDEDDVRRLLFVALTRAKNEMALFRAGGQTLRELDGEVTSIEVTPSPEEAVEIIKTSWEERFTSDSAQFISLLVPDLVPKALSVSALNSFVEYREGALGSREFPLKSLLRLPRKPNPATEFGNIVHAFLEDYVNKSLAKGAPAPSLVEHYRNKVLFMDFSEEEVSSYASRFDRIVDVFVPSFFKSISGRLMTEVELTALSESAVPLYGKSDLLMIDDDSKRIRIIDYKTGFSYKTMGPKTEYERQLQFYKILIEGSSDFDGYEVIEGIDVYIEPEKGARTALHEPAVSLPKADDLEHLQRLISAVWKRINAGDFDTSGFETSEEKAAAIAANVTAKGEPRKTMNHGLMQRAYEEWLIANSD